jgi:hypothetical protein
MPKAVFLVGLCGAGKTRKATEMQRKGFVFVEGFEGNPTEAQRLMDSLRAGRNCVAEEMQTLVAWYRANLEAHLKREIPGVDVEFWFFEKNIIKATLNVLCRPADKPVEDHLLINGRVYDCYDFPTDPKAIILPIERPTLWPSGRPSFKTLRLLLVRAVLTVAWVGMGFPLFRGRGRSA